MTKPSLRPESGELVLEGELLILRVAELKEELLMSLESVDELLVNLVETADIDLSVMQLLCAARRAAVRMNKDLALVGQSSKVGESLRLAGFSGPGGCVRDCREKCLWSGTGGDGAAG